MPRPPGSKNKKKNEKAQNLRKRASKDSPPVHAPEPKRIRTEKALAKDQGKHIESRKAQYCWSCHLTLQDGETGYSKPCCLRVYHSKCLKGNKSNLNLCPECQLETVDGTPISKPVPPNILRSLLPIIMNRRRKEDSFKNHEVFGHWPRNTEDDVVNVMDFEILDKKIKSSAYSKASEFFSDTKWILHNCFINYGSISEVTSDAKQLVKFFKVDLVDLEACYECFYYGNSFIRVCNPPHIIIWAKMKKFSSWPAKLLKVNKGSVYVKFFKTHDIGKDIPISRCHFISYKHPNGDCPQSVVPAFDEFKEYILAYEEAFGPNSFQCKDKATAFTPSKIPKTVPQVSAPKSNVEKGSYIEQPQSSSTSQNSFGVNMPFSVGQNKSPGEPPLTESTNRSSNGIDILSYTTTKVITSTPIVATSSDISSDDLTLGADFSNSFPGELNSNNMSELLSGSGRAYASASGASFDTPSTSHSSYDLPGPSTSNSSNREGWQQSISSINTLLGALVDNEFPNDRSSALMTCSQNSPRYDIEGDNIASCMISYILMMWSIVKCSPSSSQIISHAYKDLQRFQRFSESLKKENRELKLQCSDLLRAVSKLQYELSETTKKNEQLQQEFQDATKNARTIVQSITEEMDQICKSKLEAQKKEYELKLNESGTLMEACEKHLKTMKSDYDALKIKYLQSINLPEKPSSESPAEKETLVNNELSTNELQDTHISPKELFQILLEKSISRKHPGGLFRHDFFNSSHL